MSHTNSTTNYALPQFLTTDKPAWLTDINNAFSDIDSAVYAAKSKADTAFTDAGNAQTDATTAINNAAAADSKGSGAIASIEANFDPTTIYSVGAKVMYNSLLYRCIVAVTTPGPWTGSDNWERITVDSLITTAESKIGSLSSLVTVDKTSVVNAINETNSTMGNWKIKSILLTSTTNISYADANTIGYRTTSETQVNIANLTGYPTGKNILGYSVEYAYMGSNGYVAIGAITGTTFTANSKISGTCTFGIRVYYTETA